MNINSGCRSLYWAAVHAWYALGQLKATEAIGPLLDLMEKYPYMFDADLPKVFVLMGEDSNPGLRDYLWDTSRFEDSRGFIFLFLDQLGFRGCC